MIYFTYEHIYDDYCEALKEGDYKYAEYVKQQAMDDVVKEIVKIAGNEKELEIYPLMTLYKNLSNMNPDGGV